MSAQQRNGVGTGAVCCFSVVCDQGACSIKLGVTLHVGHDDILAQLEEVLGVGSYDCLLSKIMLLPELLHRDSFRNQPSLQNCSTEVRAVVLLLGEHLLLSRAALVNPPQHFLLRYVLLWQLLLRHRLRWNPILIGPLQLHFLYGHHTVLRLLGLGDLRHARPWW